MYGKWSKRSGTKINQTSGEAMHSLACIFIIIIYWWIIDFPYSHAVTPVQLRESEFMNYAWTKIKVKKVGSEQMSTKNYWLHNIWIYIIR